jgi:hypothetical protein
VGAEEGWKEVFGTFPRAPVPFDEPTLGIIGMWRLGGGANPHFALALGEIMMRVGQRYVAWCAYERAVQLSDRFWPDEAIRQQLVQHCRRRQAIIEEQMPEEVKEFRPRFQAELAYGRRYQEAYQRYEAQRIADGASIEDPHFYDAFHAEHGPIASPVGDAEKYVAKSENIGFAVQVVLASIVFFAGLFAFGTALGLRGRGP